jgi:hypothetical protein
VTRVRDQYRAERGHAALTLLAVAGLILPGPLVLLTFGQALGAKGRHQRAADRRRGLTVPTRDPNRPDAVKAGPAAPAWNPTLRSTPRQPAVDDHREP